MSFIWFFIAILVSRFLGIIPMCNIVGSIQHRRWRGTRITAATISIHSTIVIGLGVVVYFLLGTALLLAYALGMALALLKALTSGTIE